MFGGLKRLGPLLFCLFLIAQIGGVIPSVYVEALHEYGRFDATETAAAPAVTNPYGQPRQHQPGTQNKHDQCCTLHHGMIGTLVAGDLPVRGDRHLRSLPGRLDRTGDGASRQN